MMDSLTYPKQPPPPPLYDALFGCLKIRLKIGVFWGNVVKRSGVSQIDLGYVIVVTYRK
jgi:hypothetical protein